MTLHARSALVLAFAFAVGCGSHEEPAPERHRSALHPRHDDPPASETRPAPPRASAPTAPTAPSGPSAPLELPGEAPERPAPLTRAQITLANTRCDDGRGRECWLVGGIYERGEGVPVDAARARRAYERACSLPGGYGCDELARLDPANADAHLVVGCDAGRATSCAALGVRDQDGNAARIERACTLGNLDACTAVTRVITDATPAPAGTPTELSRLPASVTDATVRAAARRCDENMASMCAWLAVQYAEEGPHGVPVDVGHALALSRRACNDTALAGCLLVGEILVMNESDVAVAGPALARSCAAANGEACDAIALVLDGIPEAADDVALTRFEACMLGFEEDCSAPE